MFSWLGMGAELPEQQGPSREDMEIPRGKCISQVPTVGDWLVLEIRSVVHSVIQGFLILGMEKKPHLSPKGEKGALAPQG